MAKLPTIHVWDANSRETLVILKTAHRAGVLHLQFSNDGHKLVSVGMDKAYSIQVFDWRQNRVLAFRNTGYFTVFAVKFNPYNSESFVTCGYEHMAVWKLRGSHLSCQHFRRVKSVSQPVEAGPDSFDSTAGSRNIITCVDFLSYRVGLSIQSDLIFGTSLGEITTFQQGNYFVL